MTGPPMSFMNPHLFAAILDGIGFRMIVVLECECVQGNEEYCPPRFSVGQINGTRDPRMAQFKQLLEVGVQCDNLHIPSGYLMAHQYMYVVNDGTDEHGWQYRNDWNTNIITNFQKENDAWSAFYEPNCYVRRRIWFTTIVPRNDLVRAKRLLSENCKMDAGHIRMQGELFRYEKGNMSKSWQKRKVTLFHNRMEFYSGSNKKGEVNLADCEVKMLFESQCPGKEFAFSIRNPLGTVGVLLDAENQESRRAWVLAIQYQLAMNSHEMNFPPLEYGPPTGEEPDNRVFVCSDLNIYSTLANGYIVRNAQLFNRELCLFDGETMTGRIFLEKALIQGDEKGTLISVKSFSGIQFNFSADTVDLKVMWVNGLRRQVQFIENQKLKLKNTPAEEQDDDNIPVVDRICQFYDGLWTAPAVDGEDEEYLERVFSAASENHPNHIEFCEEGTSNNHNSLFVDKPIEQPVTHIGANNSSMARKPSFRQEGSPASSTGMVRKASFKETVAVVVTPPPSQSSNGAASNSGSVSPAPLKSAASAATAAASPNNEQYKRSASGTLKPASSFINLHQASTKLIDTRRSLINPKCVLNALNQLTHRFVLVLECESRVPPVNSNGKSMRINPVTVFPARFTVGGARACRDPRVTTLDQLLAISNINPEIQLPTGWLMLHQYIHIIQQNTDENGWQYRSDWSNGAVTPKDEQWSEVCNEDKYVRRRLWMTTVVKKEDLIKAKKLLSDSLEEGVNKDAIMQGNLYVHEKGIEPLAGDHMDEKRNSLSFVKRRVLLLHNRIEFYLGAEKTGEHSLTDCEVKILVGAQCPGRKHAFSLRNSNGTVAIVFDAESKEARLRWVRYLYYQIALIAPDVNFHPFIYGPPLGDLFENKPIYAGELNKQNEFKKWMKYQFVLKLHELSFYNRDILKGRLFLHDAVLMARDDDQDFTIKTSSGLVLSVRADSMELKNSWVRAIRHQIQFCENVELRKVNTPGEELVDPLTAKERRRQFQDDGWCAPEEDDTEDNAYMQSLATAMQKNRFEFLEDEDSLISGSTNSNVSTNSIRTIEDELLAAKMSQSPKYDRGHHYSPSTLNLYGGSFSGDVKDDKKFQYVHWDKFPLFNYKIHQSLMAQYLTPEMFAQLNEKVTHKKFTLSNLIMDGVLNPDTNRVGVNVGDAECYGIFNPLLTPVIEKIHNGYNYNRDRHTNSMDISGIEMPPKVQLLFQEYVSFIRFNCVRNFTGYSFLCGTIDSERVEIENMLYKLFSLFRDDSAGEYFKLDQLTQTQKEFLDDCSYLFEVPVERYITTGTGSGADRAYPHNRGIFVNTTRNTYIWVNEEDHARIIVTDSGHDLIGTFGHFARLHALIEELAKKLGHSFMHSDSLGYLSSNLTHLGTGLKISVLVYLPTFNRIMTERSKDANRDVDAITLLEDVCAMFHLTSSGENGVHTSARDDKFDICNTQYLGVSEAEVLSKLIAGVTSLIEFDILLSNGATVEEVRQVMKRPTPVSPKAGAAPTLKAARSFKSAGHSSGATIGGPSMPAAQSEAPQEEEKPAPTQALKSARSFKSAGHSTGAVIGGPSIPAAQSVVEEEPARPAMSRFESSKSFLVDPVKSQTHDEDYNASFEAALEKMREAERIMNQVVQREPTPEPVVVNNVVEVNNEENTETVNNTKHTEVKYETHVEERYDVVSGEELNEVVREYSQQHYNATHPPTTTILTRQYTITNGESKESDPFAMPPLNTISERRRLEEEGSGSKPSSPSNKNRGNDTFFDSAFQDDRKAAASAGVSQGPAPELLAQAIRNAASDSDHDDDYTSAPKSINLPGGGSNDEVVVTPVPKNTPMSAPVSAVGPRKPLPTTYQDSDSEDEDDALKNARAAMAAHSGSARAAPAPAASAVARKVEYDSSDDDSDNEAMKNAMAAINARNAAPTSVPAPAPAKASPSGSSSQPSALIASLFNKKPAETESTSMKAQFAGKTSTVEPPKSQSPVPPAAAEEADKTPSSGRNFVVPTGAHRSNSLALAIQAQTDGPSELETVQLQETNNLDKNTGEVVNRHSLWEAEELQRQKEREHHERLVALRPVEVNTPTPAAAAAAPVEELTGPARLVKLRSVANPNPIFVNDLAAAAAAAQSPLPTNSPMPQQNRPLKSSPDSNTAKLSIDVSASASVPESRIPAPSPAKVSPASSASESSPAPPAAAAETETPTGPKRLVKLRSVAKLTDYGTPTKLPGPVNREASPMRTAAAPSPAPPAAVTPTASAPKAVTPLVPPVPAPFVPQQSVKLKSTGTSEKAADVPAAPASEATPSPPKPMFKLRSTGFGVNNNATSDNNAAAAPPVGSPPAARPGLTHQASISKTGEYKPPASFVPKTNNSASGVPPLLSVKLRSTGILNNEVNNTTVNEVHVKATVPVAKTSGESSTAPSQLVKLRSVSSTKASE